MYKRLAFVTISAVFFLILVGGVVRATGSGMGCPDWPKCFGTWIPPTHESQLPDNYAQLFGEKLKGEVEFNAFKTWTEYINRLMGVLIGFLIFGTLIFAIKDYWKSSKTVVFYSFMAFFFVAFEGWLGSKVVSMELSPVMVTIHMLGALLVVFFLIMALYKAYSLDGKTHGMEIPKHLQFVLKLLLILSFVQLLIGTQIREQIDQLNFSGVLRDTWIERLDGMYYVHILLAIIVLIGNSWLYLKNINLFNGFALRLSKWMWIIVLSEFVIGLILGLVKMPALAQPIHLTLGTLILGVQFGLILITRVKIS
ncbi:COX15/CtaA family protein [Jiulongibacter sp. NS-SX5]|uniref:COX15/CtaA family protein n=1 Tax=Jiulongibacter sp. NS-SX5 TaxID=3463854 RepID=UPI004057EE46